VEAGALVPYRLRHDLPPASLDETDLRAADRRLENRHWTVDAGNGAALFSLRARDGSANGGEGSLPIVVRLELIDDASDTWSHDITGYDAEARECAVFERVAVEEDGPIRGRVRGDGPCGRGELTGRVTLHREERIAELEVVVDWSERLTVAKLVFDVGRTITRRRDGVPAGTIERPQNGYEFPVVDYTMVESEGGARIGIVAPDAFGLDGSGSTVRFTLLRSPAHAWQGRKGGLSADESHRWTDRGEHRFRFFVMLDADENRCRAVAEQAHEPPVVIDWTAGMRAERGEGMVAPPWTE